MNRQTAAQGLQASDRGQSTVEFALVLPMLFIVGLGLAYVGATLLAEIEVENDVRLAARAAALSPNNAHGEAVRAIDLEEGKGVSVAVGSEHITVTVTKKLPAIPVIDLAPSAEATLTVRREDISR